MIDSLRIAMFGQKHMLSRDGGVEIVVKELATRMRARGCKVIVYDRSSSHISGDISIDRRREYSGVKIIVKQFFCGIKSFGKFCKCCAYSC